VFAVSSDRWFAAVDVGKPISANGSARHQIVPTHAVTMNLLVEQRNAVHSVGNPALCSEASTDPAFARELSHRFLAIAASAVAEKLWTPATMQTKSFRQVLAAVQVANRVAVPLVARAVSARTGLKSYTDQMSIR